MPRCCCRSGAGDPNRETDVAQTLLSVPALATTENRKPLAAGGSGTDKSVCATSSVGYRATAARNCESPFASTMLAYATPVPAIMVI